MRQFWTVRLVSIIIFTIIGILYYLQNGEVWYIYALALINIIGIPIAYYLEKRRQRNMKEQS
ncbi:hypothetical protein [Granulicatella seriolae]|uniref:Uncharacterized protein n=1 Tax=Granulicatella seriolae TaxID=2967226 RepID=A0ABT1WT60_9LACT|nr:hypothetical protein [Granulicatella seriolae]